MPVNKKQKQNIKQLKQKADNLHRAVSEFERILSESGQEVEQIRLEVNKIIDKEKMKKVLKKIINIENN